MSNPYVLLVSGPRDELLAEGASLDVEELKVAAHGGYVGRLDETIPAVNAALKLFKPLQPQAGGSNDGYLALYAPTNVDGGNGSGGGDAGGAADNALKVRAGFHGKSYWNFRACPPYNDGDVARFPPLLRFEACLYFSNFKQARDFLNDRRGTLDTNLQRLDAVFKFVQLVAITDKA